MKLDHRFNRRNFLWVSTVLGSATLLGACQREPVKFNSTDLTGVDYGATLQGLRDPLGKMRSVADFKDKVLAVFFGFTQCPDVCPTTLNKLKEIKTRLGQDGERLAVVFVTVDPERDTPELMAQYVAAFDPAFIPLHGDLATVQKVAKDFKVFFEKTGDIKSGRYVMNHTAGIYLFDPAGRLRLYASHGSTPEETLKDVQLLLHGH
jgi:protein SCO1/2